MSTVLVRALLAYSVHEHQVGSATRLHVILKPHSCTVEDDGRGIGLNRDGYVSGLLEQLSAGRSEVALHGIGLAIVAMSSPLLTVESRRGGQLCTQTYSWGVAAGPMRSESTDETTGTRVTFVLPEEAPAIDDGDVLEQVELWRAAHPGFLIDIQVSA